MRVPSDRKPKKEGKTINEKIADVLRKITEDETLAAKMSAIQDPDEAYKLASSLQDGFTKEEFITAMKELAAANGDLTDDDLKKFAGGDDTVYISIGVSYIMSSGVSVAAAAAI